jgi:Fe-S cluster biogenesis protein NfuA
MQIERKQLNDTEYLLFFAKPLSIVGTFIATQTIPSSIELLQNIFSTNLANTLLLTSDFLYVKSNSPETLSDLEMISCAEIDDFTNQNIQLNSPSINIIEKIEIILKVIVAPFLQKDGGDIRLADYSDNTVYVNFLGKCQGCPYAQRTLKERVAKNIIRYLPEIKEVALI